MKTTFSSTYSDLADFDSFAKRAKQAGATHIAMSPNLPWSYWEYDQPGDPYPAWVVPKPSLLKIATPPALRAYIPADYSEKVMGILEARCRILRQLGLKGIYHTMEPSMLPEAVFTDHPLWRGTRVDHPARSRVARFAPTIDHPEVRELYRQAIAILLKRCPEIDTFGITTNDSGAGLDWSPGLYSGRFGNTLFRDRPMDQRIREFFDALRAGARDVNGSLEIYIGLTREPDPALLARKLEAGTAIENREGPNATPFTAGANVGEDYSNPFYPVYGIPRPVEFVDGLVKCASSPAPRRGYGLSDRLNRDLYFAILERFPKAKVDDPVSKLAFLKDVAAAQVGADKAADLLRIWLLIDECVDLIYLLNTGGILFSLGGVHQRWITRPFVPFPEELTPDEKSHYRRFQFQALSEDYANSLADVQACDAYYGWSGRHFVRRVTDPVEAKIKKAVELARTIGDNQLAQRLEVFNCILRNTRNAVSYQAQLDRIKQLGIKPLAHSVIGSQSDWDRQLMMETVRSELDNTAVLMDLLRPAPGQFLMLAGVPEEEDIRILGPNILEQLQKKINIMNGKWEDYKRVFTTPNW